MTLQSILKDKLPLWMSDIQKLGPKFFWVYMDDTLYLFRVREQVADKTTKPDLAIYLKD